MFMTIEDAKLRVYHWNVEENLSFFKWSTRCTSMYFTVGPYSAVGVFNVLCDPSYQSRDQIIIDP